MKYLIGLFFMWLGKIFAESPMSVLLDPDGRVYKTEKPASPDVLDTCHKKQGKSDGAKDKPPIKDIGETK